MNWRILLATLVSMSMASVCFADATPASIFGAASVFGDHMVLQREMPIPVWGTARPREKISVRLGGRALETRADAKGEWRVTFDPFSPGGGPLKMTVSGKKNAVEFGDILVGEVWVCSGQSNMELGFDRLENAGEEEIARAKYPSIRLFHVPRRSQAEPAADVAAKWTSCTPETVKDFSEIAYYFGRDLQQELAVPIGLIATAYSGTNIEPWIPLAGFQSVPELSPFVEEIEKRDAEYRALLPDAVAQTEAWLPKAKKALKTGERVARPPEWPMHPLRKRSRPCALYNGMVHPLVPYAMRGVIWYQGESNLYDGPAYTLKMKGLIQGWRALWGEGDFPFYYVQVAPYAYGKMGDNKDKPEYTPYRLPELWEAQTDALSVPNTGMVVINDLGDLDNIHPAKKEPVSKRLALWALAKTYGREGRAYSGPLYDSMSVEDDKIRIGFEHAGGLKSSDGQPLSWFEIAGADGKYLPADATIDGRTVVVGSSEVAQPTAVRFAWHETAQPNLVNGAGLPASAFRTDKPKNPKIEMKNAVPYD